MLTFIGAGGTLCLATLPDPASLALIESPACCRASRQPPAGKVSVAAPSVSVAGTPGNSPKVRSLLQRLQSLLQSLQTLLQRLQTTTRRSSLMTPYTVVAAGRMH